MGNEPLKEIPTLPPEIKEAAEHQNLVLFVGAGVSMRARLPSWSQLADSAIESVRLTGGINHGDCNDLRSLDPKKRISIANSLVADLPSRIAKVIEKAEDAGRNETNVYESIHKIGVTCVTTNYDTLLRPSDERQSRSPTTGVEAKRLWGPSSLRKDALSRCGNIIHLHGVWRDPSSMILTTRHYLTFYNRKEVGTFLEELFNTYVVLFIGYGLEELEIVEHILRRGSASLTDRGARRIFSVQGYFSANQNLFQRMRNYFWDQFRLSHLGYLKDHLNHEQLDELLADWAAQLAPQPTEMMPALDKLDRVLRHG